MNRKQLKTCKNMVDTNPTMLIIALNVNNLKDIDLTIFFYKKLTLNITQAS